MHTYYIVAYCNSSTMNISSYSSSCWRQNQFFLFSTVEKYKKYCCWFRYGARVVVDPLHSRTGESFCSGGRRKLRTTMVMCIIHNSSSLRPSFDSSFVLLYWPPFIWDFSCSDLWLKSTRVAVGTTTSSVDITNCEATSSYANWCRDDQVSSNVASSPVAICESPPLGPSKRRLWCNRPPPLIGIKHHFVRCKDRDFGTRTHVWTPKRGRSITRALSSTSTTTATAMMAHHHPTKKIKVSSAAFAHPASLVLPGLHQSSDARLPEENVVSDSPCRPLCPTALSLSTATTRKEEREARLGPVATKKEREAACDE